MPEAIITPNLVALPITSQELGGEAFPPTKISDSTTTIGLSRHVPVERSGIIKSKSTGKLM